MSDTPESAGPSSEPTFEERVAACPFHEWVGDVDSLLAQSSLTSAACAALHELMFLRGQYQPLVLRPQRAEFVARAKAMLEKSNIEPNEVRPILLLFRSLQSEWAAAYWLRAIKEN